jgi:hypothetical protein
MKTTVQNIVVDNEIVEWDCQEYVFDIFEKLEKKIIVDEKNDEYREVKKILKKKCDPIIWDIFMLKFCYPWRIIPR